MADFVFVYRAPKGYQPGAGTIETWNGWFQRLGSTVQDFGRQVADRANAGEVEDTSLAGYSIITADDMKSAVALAKTCPLVEAGGGVEVGNLLPAPQF
jgi:hypothetical protein